MTKPTLRVPALTQMQEMQQDIDGCVVYASRHEDGHWLIRIKEHAVLNFSEGSIEQLLTAVHSLAGEDGCFVQRCTTYEPDSFFDVYRPGTQEEIESLYEQCCKRTVNVENILRRDGVVVYHDPETANGWSALL